MDLSIIGFSKVLKHVDLFRAVSSFKIVGIGIHVPPDRVHLVSPLLSVVCHHHGAFKFPSYLLFI